jgi:hypothetical protein
MSFVWTHATLPPVVFDANPEEADLVFALDEASSPLEVVDLDFDSVTLSDGSVWTLETAPRCPRTGREVLPGALVATRDGGPTLVAVVDEVVWVPAEGDDPAGWVVRGTPLDRVLYGEGARRVQYPAPVLLLASDFEGQAAPGADR